MGERLDNYLGSEQQNDVITLLENTGRSGAAEAIFNLNTGKIAVARENILGKRTFMVQRLALENENDVTQGAGGAMINPDEHVQRVTLMKFTDFRNVLRFKDLVSVSGISANKLIQFWKAYTGRGINRNLCPFEDAVTGVSSNSQVRNEIPVWEGYPGDPMPGNWGMDIRLLDKCKFELSVAAATDVNANLSSIADDWRLKAYGYWTDRVVIPPRLVYEYYEYDSESEIELKVGGNNGTLLMVALVDESGELIRSTDMLTIENDENVIKRSNEKTIGELWAEQNDPTRNLGLSPYASAGSISGIHNSVFVGNRNLLYIIDPGERMSRRLHPKSLLRVSKGSTYASAQFRFFVVRAIRSDKTYLDQCCQRILGTNFPGGHWLMGDGQKELVQLSKSKKALPIEVNV